MLKPYESYKETNIPWAKSIPQHWKLLRNKNILIEQKDVVGSNSRNYTLLSLTLKGVIARDMESGKGKFPKDFDTYKVVEKDNIIFCLFDIDETPRTVGLSPLNGMITGAYDVFNVENINKDFLFYYYLNIDTAKAMKPLYTGLRKVIGVPRFLGTKLPVPSTQEQEQIVKYLDWQASKINKLINGKKKQIELLKEQKQAVINQAVTKGLDPNVEMKDSGVARLGEIPKHWEVKPLKYFVSTNNETLSNNVDKNYELDYIDIGSVGFGYLKLAPEHYKFSSAPSRARRVVHTNDTIVSTVRTYLKSMCFIDEHLDGFIASTGFSVLTPNRKVLPQILSYSLCSDYFVNEVDTRSKGISYPAITDIDLISIKIALPNTIREQENIHKYITVITSKIDQIISKSQAEINIVLEYKTRLISDVVTGQVDVRNVVVPEFVAEEVIVDVEELEDLEEVEGEV